MNIWDELLKVYNMPGIPDEAMSIIGDVMLAWSEGQEGDTISRKAAIDVICVHGTELERRGITVLSVANHKQVTVDLLESLPSAQPTYTDEEIQKMQDLEQAQIEKAYQLGYEEGKKDAQSDHTADGDKMDCISRQAALEKHKSRKPDIGADGSRQRHRYLQWIADGEAILETPSAQPEIIRCKDCKYYEKQIGWNCIEFQICSCSPMHNPIRQENDFCSLAERREEGEPKREV